MGQKPSLTLELDSHTADVGLETRIEAFLDIVAAYRKLAAEKKIPARKNTFKPAGIVMDSGAPAVITSSGEKLPFSDPRVTVMISSIGDILTRLDLTRDEQVGRFLQQSTGKTSKRFYGLYREAPYIDQWRRTIPEEIGDRVLEIVRDTPAGRLYSGK